MRPRPAILIASLAIIAIVLIAVGAWWLLRLAPRPTATTETAPTEPAAPTNAAAPPVVTPPARAPEPAAHPPTIAAAEELARAIGLELATGPTDGPVLMAVEEGSERPIAGVLMIVNEYRPIPGNVIYPSPPGPPHRLRFLKDRGSAARQLTYVTGDDGRVRVARLVANSAVVAYHPSFEGSTWLRDDVKAEVRIALRPTKLLRVRVIDGAGRPRAKVPIEVTEATAKRELISAGFMTQDDGLLELHPLEFLPPRRGRFDLVRVALALPLQETVTGAERLVDPSHLPDEPFELTLPPTGSLAVRVVDGAGSLLRDASGSFDAGTVEAADAREKGRQIELTQRARGQLPLTDGSGELAPVGLGLTFKLYTYSVGHGGDARIVAGPRTDGERIEVEISQPREKPTLSGRLIDQTGAPCASAHAIVHFLRPDAGALPNDRDEYDGCLTDATGRFRMSRSAPKGPRTLFRFIVLDDHGLWNRRGERLADTEPTGALELGDVVVETLGVLAAGVVVDRAGDPVDAAQIRVKARARGDSRGRDGFRNIEGLGGASGVDGRFEIHGPVGPSGDEELLLEAASAFLHASGTVSTTPGTSDLRIVLKRARRVVLAALLDDGVPPAAIRIQYRANEREPWRWEVPLAPDGTQSLELDGGTSLDLRFIARGLERDPVELLVVPQVALADDPTTRDPRLDPVDLRGRLVVTKLLVRDGAGHPVADARATLWTQPRDAAGDSAFDVAEARARDVAPVARNWRGSPPSFESSVDGILSLLAARASLTVEVTAPGCVPQRLETSAGERTLVLERSTSVRLEIAEAWLVSNLPWHLRAALIPDHGDGAADAPPTRALQSGYALDAPVAGPGRYRVRVTVARLFDDGRLLERELTPTPATIEVGDPPTRLPIEVHVDPEALRKLDPERR